MPITKRQKAADVQRELVAYLKALGNEMGYTMELLSERLGMCRQTLSRKFQDPKQLTVGEIDKLCQILHPDETHEKILRGFML